MCEANSWAVGFPSRFKRDFNGCLRSFCSLCVCVCSRTLRGKLKWPQVAGVKRRGGVATKMPLGQSRRLCGGHRTQWAKNEGWKGEPLTAFPPLSLSLSEPVCVSACCFLINRKVLCKVINIYYASAFAYTLHRLPFTGFLPHCSLFTLYYALSPIFSRWPLTVWRLMLKPSLCGIYKTPAAPSSPMWLAAMLLITAKLQRHFEKSPHRPLGPKKRILIPCATCMWR